MQDIESMRFFQEIQHGNFSVSIGGRGVIWCDEKNKQPVFGLCDWFGQRRSSRRDRDLAKSRKEEIVEQGKRCKVESCMDRGMGSWGGRD